MVIDVWLSSGWVDVVADLHTAIVTPWSIAALELGVRLSTWVFRRGPVLAGACSDLRKRPHELHRANRISRVNPSSGTALETESPIKGTEYPLHFRREHLEWSASTVASQDADAYCLLE